MIAPEYVVVLNDPSTVYAYGPFLTIEAVNAFNDAHANTVKYCYTLLPPVLPAGTKL